MKNTTPALKPATKILIIFVIIVHIMFFILETVFWMKPAVHIILLKLLHNPVEINYVVQALTLKRLFINQGFYNLFIAFLGMMGLYLFYRKIYAPGLVLILSLCFCGFGAGIVLACSTEAYLLAFFQVAPAAVAFFKVYFIFKSSIRKPDE
jgi:putative membrane protein